MDRILTLGKLNETDLGDLQNSAIDAICAVPAPLSHDLAELQVRWLEAATSSEAIASELHRPEYRPAFTKLLLETRPQLVHVTEVQGWNLDLVRTAALLGCPVTIDLRALDTALLTRPDGGLVADALSYAAAFIGATPEIVNNIARLAGRPVAQPLGESLGTLRRLFEQLAGAPQPKTVDYSDYEFGLRDQGLIEAMQRPHVRYFRECRRVLDVASGPGTFLGLLAAVDVVAEGVERNAAAVRYAQGLGYTVRQQDAVTYLEQCNGQYDGLYCSHFIEHLPVADAERLLHGAYNALQEGGIAVFIFPDPESIRSQLLGFWRDPEHVRFYHPELVALMARSAGFEVVQGGEGRGVPPFPEQCPLAREPANTAQRSEAASRHGTSASTGFSHESGYRPMWRNTLRKLGILPGRDALAHQQGLSRRISALESELEALRTRELAAHKAIHALWSINRTWAWDDNACLVLHKGAGL